MLAIQYMPVVIKGLCLAALLAVIMSTADTVLLIAGTTMAWDLVGGFEPELGDETRVRIARLTVFGAGAIGAVFALLVSGLFDVLLLAFAVYVASLFVPMMAALFWEKATKAGAFASASSAFVTLAVLYGMKFAGRLPESVEPIIVSMALGLVVMVAVSLGTWREDDENPPLSKLTVSP